MGRVEDDETLLVLVVMLVVSVSAWPSLQPVVVLPVVVSSNPLVVDTGISAMILIHRQDFGLCLLCWLVGRLPSAVAVR